jgi:hypothetical protein
MELLKQSTTATVLVGPVLAADGTAYTSMAIGDFNLTKNGTTAAMASTSTATHSHEGHYLIAMKIADSDTLGRLDISCNKSTYAMPPARFSVVTANVFDSIIGGTDLLDVSVTQFGGSAGTFSNGRPEVNASHWGGTAVASAYVIADTRKLNGLLCDGSLDASGPVLGLSQLRVIGDKPAEGAIHVLNMSATGIGVSSTGSVAGIGVVGDLTTGMYIIGPEYGLTCSGAESDIALYQSGAITDVSGNVILSLTGLAGKVLGGGAGTITGVGARVVDASGNNVAPASDTAAILEDTGDTGVVVAAGSKAGYSLSAAGIDAILIESGISASAILVNDTGTQLTSINARQALALVASALEGVLAGADTTTITTKPSGKPAASNRVSATVDEFGNRSALVLRVPD